MRAAQIGCELALELLEIAALRKTAIVEDARDGGSHFRPDPRMLTFQIDEWNH
jgi:hypothetical protein